MTPEEIREVEDLCVSAAHLGMEMGRSRATCIVPPDRPVMSLEDWVREKVRKHYEGERE